MNSIDLNDLVFILATEESLECGYCGEAIEDGYLRGDFNIYCSADCRIAGRTWCWICMLLIIFPYFLMFWLSYDYTIEILPYLFVLSLITLYIAFLAVQGFRTRRRISRKKKSDKVEYVEYN